jgi:hypothetical protein
MKFLFIVCLTILSQTSLASDQNKSQLMEEVMIKAGVESLGRRQWMQADITCKNNRKQIFSCHLIAGGEDNDIFVEYFAEEALFISNLLTSFGLNPEGRHSRQQGSFNCQLLSRNSKGDRVCELEVFDDVF